MPHSRLLYSALKLFLVVPRCALTSPCLLAKENISSSLLLSDSRWSSSRDLRFAECSSFWLKELRKSKWKGQRHTISSITASFHNLRISQKKIILQFYSHRMRKVKDTLNSFSAICKNFIQILVKKIFQHHNFAIDSLIYQNFCIANNTIPIESKRC